MNEMIVDKQDILNIFAQLPNKVSIEEVIEALYVLAQIKQGLQDFQEGNYITTEDLKREIETW